VTTRGEGWRRTLDLRRSGSGGWTIEAQAHGNVHLPAPGGDPTDVAEALDCDLSLCPLTNTMPVLRHDLLRSDGSADFVMAWVSVPDLAVSPSRQRYTTLGRLEDGGRLIRYESLDSDFKADVSFDPDGLVVDYPGLARRVS
jgi:hypothetical protein